MRYLKTYESINPVITYYPNGKKELVAYLNKNNNGYHNYNGPARQEWYENGQKKTEEYWINGKRHRLDGPAVQKWYDNGQKESSRYIINDKFHREDGTAIQFWYKNGQKQSEHYYINGIIYTRRAWIEKLKKINSPHYKKQKLEYEAELYNL